MNEIRLNKYISDKGLCSRREADTAISNGLVLVNEKIASLGDKISSSDKVIFKGKAIETTNDKVYLAFNKPIGITCTTEHKIAGNIIDYINYPKRIFPIGRLDKPSEGLILLTNDGDIVNKILRAGNNHEKEYLVWVNKKINNEFISSMKNGVSILGTCTKPCKIYRENDTLFRIILTEGLNRQIRKMCAVFDYKVIKLKRIRIMNIPLDLKTGKWRYLTPSEINEINHLIGSSIKTEEASR
ncbi:MAG: pseudouridine synthase [Clostridiaceae bacterium]